jgi:hypothetical protein
MINGNTDCENRCGLDSILSLERSKDKRNTVFYRLKSSDNFWRVSLTLLSLSFSLSHACLRRPLRVLQNSNILYGQFALRNQIPSCHCESLLAVAIMKSRQRKMREEFLPSFNLRQHLLKFLPERIQEALKSINGINCLQYFAVTFNVNFFQIVYFFTKKVNSKEVVM